MRQAVRPLLIAHRGDPAHAPENSLASFRKAIAKGARAVEMDLRRLPGGSWVVFHDPISRLPSKPHSIPSASQAISLCKARRAQLFLDVKSTSGEAGLAGIIRRSGWAGGTTVLAGSAASLGRWRRLLPERPVYWVTGYRQSVTPSRIAEARRLGLAGFVAYKGRVTRRTVEKVRLAGMRLMVWTIRTKQELVRFSRLGVDGIMSELWPAPSI